MSQPPTSSIFTINTSPVRGATQYNGKIIIASLAMLFFVVLFILVLHIYVKWFWQRSLRRQQAAMWQRRQQGFPMEGDGREAMTFGLDKAIVDSMPTFVYKVTDKEALECAVCLSEFQENEKGRLLPKCSHRFHIDCIDMWFLSHSTCPLCRTSAELSHSMVSTLQELELSVLSRAEGLVLRQQQGYGGHLEYTVDGAVPAALDHGGESLPSPGWRWRRSTSDGYTQNPRAGVQFPTNVLFWGNNSHVSSHASSTQVVAPPPLEHGQRGGLSLPHLAIDIPRRTVNIPRCSSSGAASQSYACASDQQQCKSPGTGLNVFKRLLSRERKVFPAEPNMGVCSSNSNSHAVGPSSAAASMGQ